MLKCIVCGCSEFEPCVNADGETCAWVMLGDRTIEINGGGLCSFCAAEGSEDDDDDVAFIGDMREALERGFTKPLNDPPLVELVSDHEADQFIRQRRRA